MPDIKPWKDILARLCDKDILEDACNASNLLDYPHNQHFKMVLDKMTNILRKLNNLSKVQPHSIDNLDAAVGLLVEHMDAIGDASGIWPWVGAVSDFVDWANNLKVEGEKGLK